MAAAVGEDVLTKVSTDGMIVLFFSLISLKQLHLTANSYH
jgi:hypothetical protein